MAQGTTTRMRLVLKLVRRKKGPLTALYRNGCGMLGLMAVFVIVATM